MIGIVIAAGVMVFIRRGRDSVTPHFVFTALALTIGGVLLLGGAIFLFGWLGRATITADGLKAPRYSGFHQFLPWADIQDVKAGSLNGWPCLIVSGIGSAPVYLMQNGESKKAMARCICEYAGASNPLVEYFREHSIRPDDEPAV